MLKGLLGAGPEEKLLEKLNEEVLPAPPNDNEVPFWAGWAGVGFAGGKLWDWPNANPLDKNGCCGCEPAGGPMFGSMLPKGVALWDEVDEGAPPRGRLPFADLILKAECVRTWVPRAR